MVRAFAHGVMGRRIDPSWGNKNRSAIGYQKKVKA